MKLKIGLLAILSCCAAENIQVEHESSISTNNSTSRDLETFIVGGIIARPNEFPWLVHIQIDGKYLCGGSLISLDTVLTAAHCVYGSSAGSLIVTAGDHDLLVFEETEQTSSAKGVKWHESYNDETEANDIALIKLSKNLTNTYAVSAIPLPAISFVINATGNGTVAGWGTTAFGDPNLAQILLKVTVPIVNNTMCRRSYAELTDSQFCAGQKGKDSCQGDSGGPFICNGTNAVCGIVSYGKGCGKDRYPGVYTKVSSYISWINTNYDFNMSTTIPPSSTLTTPSPTTPSSRTPSPTTTPSSSTTTPSSSTTTPSTTPSSASTRFLSNAIVLLYTMYTSSHCFS